MRRIFFICCALTALLSACGTGTPRLPGGLTLEEHVLARAPRSDSFTFEPVEGTQEGVLARHASERSQRIPLPIVTVNGNPAMEAGWNEGVLTAEVFTDPLQPPAQIAQVSHAGEVIFSAPAGMPSPLLPLQGLWTYDGHWALEIALATPEVWAGQVYIDGESVNEAQGYEEAFGFQTLSGKPFYFFRQAGQLGFSYDGRQAFLPYDSIPHYLCCSESVLNPQQAREMTAFFAQRGNDWFYVELGNFSGQ